MPKLIDTVARRFTIGVLLVAVGAGLFWWGKDPAQVWLVVTAVLIVACPCALALSMPFAYGHTIRLMGKRGLFCGRPKWWNACPSGSTYSTKRNLNRARGFDSFPTSSELFYNDDCRSRTTD